MSEQQTSSNKRFVLAAVLVSLLLNYPSPAEVVAEAIVGVG